MRRLDALGIPYEVVPGVPAFAGAAARLMTELTLPEISQTIILTRTSGKASPMPESERLEVLGASKATLAIHLSIRNLGYVEEALTPHYGADCPVVIVYRATWPDEEVIFTTLSDMKGRVREEKITRTALVFVGRVFGERQFRDSRLYDQTFAHVLRNAGKKKDRAKS
jgi:precorrin-4/cobalt-precorrin-4 C11-methyltransferase